MELLKMKNTKTAMYNILIGSKADHMLQKKTSVNLKTLQQKLCKTKQPTNQKQEKKKKEQSISNL